METEACCGICDKLEEGSAGRLELGKSHEEASLLDRVAEHGRIDACRPWTWTLADTLILIPIESFSRLGPLFSS